MKIITYHYIKSFNNRYPFFNFLDKKKFEKQLKFFEKKFGIIKNENEIYKKNNKVLLTFDDGFKDHLYAAKLLKKMNRTGIFFPNTLTLTKNDLLNVHKTHLILGKIKPKTAITELINYFKKRKIVYEDKKLKVKHKNVYKRWKDDENKNRFKTIVNYSGKAKVQGKALDFLMKKFNINVKPKSYYLSINDIKRMAKMGMIIGSHTHSHCLLSKLSYNQQSFEIQKSKKILTNLIKKKINFFCYPHGSRFSYNKSTIKLLKKYKFKKSFTVRKGDSNFKYFLNKPYELPRYDCNLF